jgi:hypothetical protein
MNSNAEALKLVNDFTREFDRMLNSTLEDFNSLGISGLDKWADSSDPVISRNRRQVLVHFPLVAGSIVSHPNLPSHIQIRIAIDEGWPIVKYLADVARVGRDAVRFIRGKIPYSKAWAGNLIETLRIIDLVPSARRPINKLEWDVLQDLWLNTSAKRNRWRYEDSNSSSRQHDLMEFLFIGLCSMGLSECSMRLGDNLRRLRNANDYFRFVGEWCAAGAGITKLNFHVRNIAGTTLKDEFLMRYSPMELVRQAERWHREILVMDKRQLSDDSPDTIDRWPGLPGLPIVLHEVECVSLRNSLSLAIEGERMRHCVGAFAQVCLRGESHILSLRNRQGEPLSTAELELMLDKNGNPILSVIQHRGHENTDPCDLCELVLSKILDHYQAGHKRAELIELWEENEIRRCERELDNNFDSNDLATLRLGTVMDKVLRDKDALQWLDTRYIEEECFYSIRSDRLGETVMRLGNSYDLSEASEWDIYVRSGEKLWI